MTKNLYLYLFVLSALIAVFLYFNSKRIIENQEHTIRELNAKIEKLEKEE